ncbi:MAG: PspA/IM30 family protein [Planctomycetales bacterium]
MSYFSRLTEIVTCNLSELLNRNPHPHEVLPQIINEIEAGVAGARRSTNTAQSNLQKLECELQEHGNQIVYWTSMAKQELAVGNENGARMALLRKKEVEDLIAALHKEQAAAKSNLEHLLTIQRAVEARLSEAKRKLAELAHGSPASIASSVTPEAYPGDSETSSKLNTEREQQIDAELEKLRRELQG